MTCFMITRSNVSLNVFVMSTVSTAFCEKTVFSFSVYKPRTEELRKGGLGYDIKTKAKYISLSLSF